MPGTHLGDSRFVSTRWSLIAAAEAKSDTKAHLALGELAHAYWFPLYAYIRQGNSHAQSEELTQEFFTHFLEKHVLKSAAREKGRFRAFLLACVNHFLSNQRDRDHALKRGGGKVLHSLDAADARYEREVAGHYEDMTPQRLFERRWALALLEKVMSRLEADYRHAQQEAVFRGLKDLLTGDAEKGYADRARQMGMSESAVKVAAHRLRRRYRDLLKEEIAHTVDSKSDIKEEIAYLMNCL